MSNNVMFTMEDVANMLLEIEDIKAFNNKCTNKAQMQDYVFLSMLAYKTYISICKREGLFISNYVRYEHCQNELAALRTWFSNESGMCKTGGAK